MLFRSIGTFTTTYELANIAYDSGTSYIFAVDSSSLSLYRITYTKSSSETTASYTITQDYITLAPTYDLSSTLKNLIIFKLTDIVDVDGTLYITSAYDQEQVTTAVGQWSVGSLLTVSAETASTTTANGSLVPTVYGLSANAIAYAVFDATSESTTSSFGYSPSTTNYAGVEATDSAALPTTSDDSSTSLFGADRILAIKNKKLVIADCGWCIPTTATLNKRYRTMIFDISTSTITQGTDTSDYTFNGVSCSDAASKYTQQVNGTAEE